MLKTFSKFLNLTILEDVFLSVLDEDFQRKAAIKILRRLARFRQTIIDIAIKTLSENFFNVYSFSPTESRLIRMPFLRKRGRFILYENVYHAIYGYKAINVTVLPSNAY